MKLSLESFIILLLCAIDTELTCFMLSGVSDFDEANPIMAWYLRFGVGWFIFIKVLITVFGVAILEWAGYKKPRFVTLASRILIVLYAILLLFGLGKAIKERNEYYHPKDFGPELNLAVEKGTAIQTVEESRWASCSRAWKESVSDA